MNWWRKADISAEARQGAIQGLRKIRRGGVQGARQNRQRTARHIYISPKFGLFVHDLKIGEPLF